MQLSENYLNICSTNSGFKSAIPAQNFWINPCEPLRNLIDGDIIKTLFSSISVGKNFLNIKNRGPGAKPRSL